MALSRSPSAKNFVILTADINSQETHNLLVYTDQSTGDQRKAPYHKGDHYFTKKHWENIVYTIWISSESRLQKIKQ